MGRFIISLVAIAILIGTFVLFGPTLPPKTGQPLLDANREYNAQTVDKKLIITKLTERGQIVGLEATATKGTVYSDQKFNTGIELIDAELKRVMIVEVEVTFKMGYDLKDIKPAQVYVMQDAIRILSPQPVIIALDMPYDKVKFDGRTGLFRKDLSEDEKKLLYAKVKEQIRIDILKDQAIMAEANNKTQHVLEQFLKQTGIKKVVFY